MTITIWMDRELDIQLNGIPNWLAQAAMARAYELLEPVIELDDPDLDEGEEDE